MLLNTNPLWRIVSSAYAGENLELGSKKLEVYIPETSGFTNGEITAHRVMLETEGVDYKGNHYTVQIVTTNTIEASWRQQGGNRITPPDVRRGERIDIWQYENLDQYHWTASEESIGLRRLETATFAYSNTKDEEVTDIDETNSYNVKVSTHQKVIELNTTTSDGEPFTHHIQIDTKNGNMHYRDSAGNYIQVEAAAARITLENSAGTSTILDGENLSLNATAAINLNCKTLNITADTVNETAANRNNNGNLNVKGRLKNNDVDVGSTHTHPGVRAGGDRTSTPS